MSRDDELERIARIVVDCGYRLHSDLGPGLLESAYEGFLAASLTEKCVAFRRQVPVQVRYKGVAVDNAFKIDLLVEDRLVVELKSVERPVHAKQLTTYLRLMGLPLGLLMNFGLPTFKAGIQRIANGYHSGWSNE
jgi:GxxExxY protein